MKKTCFAAEWREFTLKALAEKLPKPAAVDCGRGLWPWPVARGRGPWPWPMAGHGPWAAAVGSAGNVRSSIVRDLGHLKSRCSA